MINLLARLGRLAFPDCNYRLALTLHCLVNLAFF